MVSSGPVTAGTGGSGSGAPEAAGLYLHIPFCSAICPYCDFAVKRGDRDSARRFADLLIEEIHGVGTGRLLPEAPPLAEAVSELCRAAFDTIYFGGGTPSLLPIESLGTLIEALGERFDLATGTRIFFEANPEDVTEASAAAWQRAGVNFLSLGVQALDEAALRFLGRAHSPLGARRAIEAARSADFETVSIDLIYGLPGRFPPEKRRTPGRFPPEKRRTPGQGLTGWSKQLDTVLELEPDHLSLYELEIHPRTVFGKKERRGELEALDEDSRAALFSATHRRLEAAGFDAYEVSNFARSPEHQSRHNRKYWRHIPYLGFGPSAHSLVTGPHGYWRFWNEPLEPRWRRLLDEGTSPAAGWERLTPSALALEAAMLGLRTRRGLDLDRARDLSGIDLWRRNARLFSSWQDAGWITIEDRRLLPTGQGMARADRLAAEIEIAPPRGDVP